MTKKGIILSIILAILLISIVIIACMQDNKPNRNISTNTNNNTEKINPIEETENDEFALNITDDTGFDLEKLKSYKLPIIIQCGSPEEEICKDMMEDIKTLNHEMKRKAFVKYLNTDEYQSLWKDDRLEINGKTMQILIDNEGKPFDTVESVALGYRVIKDENGNHIYTVHDGDLTLNGMRELLTQMETK